MSENAIVVWDKKGAMLATIILNPAVPPECNILNDIDKAIIKDLKKILSKYKLNPDNTSFEYASCSLDP